MRARSTLRTSVAIAALFTFAHGALAPSVALAIGVQPANATPVQREQAPAKFVRGKQLFAEKKYDEALAEFRGSMEIVASPNARLYVARSLREKGDLVAAYVELGRTEIEAKELAPQDPRYGKTGEAAAAERKELEPKLGFVTLTIENADASTTLQIGGEEVKRAGWSEPAPVMPGTTEIVVQTPGRAPVRRSVTVAAGEKTSLSIDANEGGAAGGFDGVGATEGSKPSAVKAGDPSLRTWAYVAGGIGVAGFATFAIFGALSSSKYSSLKDECGGPCPESRRDDIESGKTQQTIANVGFAVGVVGLAAGVGLFLLGSKSQPTSKTTEVVLSPSWIGLRGTF